MLKSLSRLRKLSSDLTDIPQGLIQVGCDLPLPFLLWISWRASFKKRCCLLKGRNGLSIRINAHGDLASTKIIGNGQLWKTRMFIMSGNLSTDRIQVFRIHLLERLCNTTMQKVTVRRAQGRICLLSELVMSEVIGLSCPRVLLTHNASL